MHIFSTCPPKIEDLLSTPKPRNKSTPMLTLQLRESTEVMGKAMQLVIKALMHFRMETGA